MPEKQPTELTGQELLEKIRRSKAENTMNAVIFGITTGIALYSTVKNGFGLLTCFPLLFTAMVIKNKKKDAVLAAELKTRNLK